MAWERTRRTPGAGWGRGGLGRERPKPGSVGAWLPVADGWLRGWRVWSRDMLRRGPGRFRHSALIGPS